ncbi:MAG: hypothetical protein PUG10_03445 [Lachnospiraceae bacterium]|nr:hypothetical protein [Lachnospiraceae bacterium]
MIACLGCGGPLKYDIASKKLACTYCNSFVDVEDKRLTETTAEGRNIIDDDTNMEVRIYSCPQCGAELMTANEEVTTYCSFCGAPNLIQDRIANEKKPDYIIPFKLTKEQCKEAYSKRIKKAFFSPKELRDPEYIERFRGIYMPYWYYTVSQYGDAHLSAEKSTRSGDYIYIDHYIASVGLQNNYVGITHDASLAFENKVSESIAPYQVVASKDFKTGYLCGFYAEAPDVDRDVHKPDAVRMAARDCIDRIKKLGEFKNISFKPITETDEINKTHSEVTNTQCAMFPVWFLSYKKDNCIAYAAINGQTGKMCADIPIDKKKYLVTSFVVAAILFALFNIFLVLTTQRVLDFSIILSLFSCFVYGCTINKFSVKNKTKQKDNGILTKLFVLALIIFTLPFVFTVAKVFASLVLQELPVLTIVYFIISILLFVFIQNKRKKSDMYVGAFLTILLLLGIFGALVLKLINPVEDAWYYGCSLMLTVLCVANFFGLVNAFNQKMSRPLPQFNKQGGFDFE